MHSTPPPGLEEGLFFRDLQALSNRIHATDRVDQIMVDLEPDICALFQADRMTLYTVADDGHHIVSRFKTGLKTLCNLRLPIRGSSVAGYVALQRQRVNVADAHDDAALQAIAPGLRFQKEVDQRSGYRTRQLLTAPVLHGDTLYGVLQLINTRNNEPFSALAEQGVQELCQTLAIAFRHHRQPLERPATESAPPPSAARLPGGARYQWLVDHGLLDLPTLARCLDQARETGRSSEDLLMQQGLRTADLGASLAAFFGVPYAGFQPDRLRIEALQGVLKREFVQTQGWLPLEDTPGGLQVMCLDPEAVQASRMVRHVFPRASQIQYHVTTQHDFTQTVDHMYGRMDEASVDRLLADMAETALPEDEASEASLVSAAADNELVKLVNKIVVDAYQQGASDIHIEPQPGKGKTAIRFRIDGSLQPYIEIPAAYRAPLVTRIKIMCDLDISERRKPQDGKIQFRRFGPLDIELRVATVASVGGVEDVVLRLLKGGDPLPLEQLGLSEHNLGRLLPTISKPYGLFYVCGPTGSGKTTTLHSILRQLNTPDTKIWTAEDPVEITQKGLRQVQVNKKAGIDFATVMRAFLRLDPDIIMVGESRDLETVSMGIEASLTGHLVLST
ncbi:MAG: ATPase, T2SS/T4P/T4SS family, partial [Giesbergeria sp.]|nr:ATPase, T2SS/T4P/T4SS family [Giesbergeria sp.]